MSKVVCVSCRHEIDAEARLCPYCGADPRTGEKIDTQALLQEVFQPRQISATEGVLEYARQRQGVVITIGALLVILLLAGFHQLVMRRNQAVADANAVPLTDVADLGNQTVETKPLPMPELQFQYDGNPRTMRTFIVEQGAVPPPPEVIAAQQAARQRRQSSPQQPPSAPEQQPQQASPPQQQPQPPNPPAR